MVETNGEPINGEYIGVPSPFMQRALDLAAYARGHCHPNPMVGCIIVKEGVKDGVKGGQIVGEGWHRQVGTPHAEVHALQQAGEAARGATVYVTLEPCNHWGCTPPCTSALINAGVAQVVVAMRDPNPIAQGGVDALRQAGIVVVVGDGAEESRRLNERWLVYLRQQRPFVHVKVAMSLDARVATSSGESQWITGADARHLGHQWRDSHEALLVGANTVRADNPSLTCRLPSTALQGPLPVRQPLRVVLAGAHPLPAERKLFQDEATPTLIIAADPYYRQHKAALATQGKHVEIIGVLARCGYPDPASVLQCLYPRKVIGLLLEGGPTVVAAFLDAGLVDRISTFVAPMLLGPNGVSAFRHTDKAHLDQALTLDTTDRIAVGKDTLLSGRVRQRAERIQNEVRENEVMENVYRHC